MITIILLTAILLNAIDALYNYWYFIHLAVEQIQPCYVMMDELFTNETNSIKDIISVHPDLKEVFDNNTAQITKQQNRLAISIITTLVLTISFVIYNIWLS